MAGGTTFTTHAASPLELITSSEINKIQTAINNLESGWIAAPNTWVYASPTSFTVTGVDATSWLTVGTKIKLTQTTVKYFIVTSRSFSTDTTVNVTGGSDYSLANATIASPFYSYRDNPQGYPAVFNYTPTGISASNVTLTGRFSAMGRRVFCTIHAVFTGAITYTSAPTLPIAAASTIIGTSTAGMGLCGIASYLDSGTATVLDTLFPAVAASASTCVLRISTGAEMSASSPITWANGDKITARFNYEF